MPDPRHFTTRRGFIAGLGFGAVSLYGAWAAYGAAPLLPSGGHEDAAAPEPDGHGSHGSHGGHDSHGAVAAPAEADGHGGHGAATGMAPEEFRFEHDDFVQRHTQEDGSVNPHVSGDTHSHAAGGEPVDVYLVARKFAYSPDMLRLKVGQAYRFRMMAEDITHGASIQLGSASRIIRLRPNTVTEQIITFIRPGAYLVYCTVYCGQAHDAMQGRIVVA